MEEAAPQHDGYEGLYGTDKANRNAATASVSASVINLCAAILGAGILALPAGFAAAGYMLTFILLVGSALISWFTMHLLTVVSRRIGRGSASFFMVAEECIPQYAWTIEVAVQIGCFGLASAYLVAFGELMPEVIGTNGSSIATNQYLWVTIGLMIVIPMAFAPTLDMLRFTSGGGVLAAVYLAGVAVYYFYYQSNSRVCIFDGDRGHPHCGGEFEAFRLSSEFLQTLSLVTFAFSAHIQLMAVSNEVRDYTQPKMDLICFASVAICCVMYGIIGYLGYYAFGDGVDSNALLSYPSDLGVSVARVGISLLVIISYPLMCKPFRDSSISLLKNVGSTSSQDTADSRSTFLGITTGFLCGTYILAMSLISNPNALGLILKFIGATCAILVVYVLPTAVYIILFPHEHWKRYLAMFVSVLGVAMMPVCVIAIFV